MYGGTGKRIIVEKIKVHLSSPESKFNQFPNSLTAGLINNVIKILMQSLTFKGKGPDTKGVQFDLLTLLIWWVGEKVLKILINL